jgi:C-terminal processing protease CtpA/Prc
MKSRRAQLGISLGLSLSLILAACGGEGGSSSPPTIINPTPTPSPSPTSSACGLRAQQDFADSVLNEWYLFPNLLAAANPANFNSVQSFLDARVAPARTQNRDRFFTFATSIAEESALIQQGSSAGFGIRLAFDTGTNRVFIIEAYEGANGLAAGIDRGTELLAIGTTASDLQTVSSLMASGGPQAVVNALGPSDPGISRFLRFRPLGGAITERTVTKTDFALDPISDRYGTLILNDNGKSVGYLNLRTFIVAGAASQLRTAFGEFRNAGVSELIIDLRYNGGGLVSVADVMGDLMAGQGRVGQVWSSSVLRPSKSSENTTQLLRAETNAINTTRIAFITTGASASASELVINSMLPYLGNNMALIGANTFGKPVGQFAFDLTACDLRIRAVTFQTVNSLNQGDYFNGLAGIVPNTCRAGDDIMRPFGDPQEASIAASLDFLAGRACTPITSGGTDGIAGGLTQGQSQRQGLGLPERQPLQPRNPNSAQRELPGLF